MSGNKVRREFQHYKIRIRSPCRIVLFLPFADLEVIAKEFYPIPFRTRPSKPSASMVLRLKPRESRTLPGLPRAEIREPARTIQKSPGHESGRGFCFLWFSSDE